MSCLLHFVGGHVTLEGLEFELDVVQTDEPVAAIRMGRRGLGRRGAAARPARHKAGRAMRSSWAFVPQAQLSKRVRDLSGRPQLLRGDLHRAGAQLHCAVRLRNSNR